MTVVFEFVVLQVRMIGHAKLWRYFNEFRLAYGHALLFQSGLASRNMMKPCAPVLCKEGYDRSQASGFPADHSFFFAQDLSQAQESQHEEGEKSRL